MSESLSAISNVGKKLQHNGLSGDIASGAAREPLENRLRDAFASESVDIQDRYESIMSAVTGAYITSDPQDLFRLQVKLGDYKQEVEMISAITRKGAATVETLLRA